MLWYKAWLETRSRFLIALIGITVICSYIVFHGDRNTSSYTMINWYYGVLNNANTILVLTWLLAVALLAMGGSCGRSLREPQRSLSRCRWEERGS